MRDKLVDYIEHIEEQTKVLQHLRQRIVTSLETDTEIGPCIYAVKSRVKSFSHLQEKITRKRRLGKKITKANVWEAITDLVGVRVLLLYPQYFENIHKFITAQVKKKEWVFVEQPKAYTWDEDMKTFFSKKLKIITESKESLYTSVHYVIRLPESRIACEIQVRTLWEEIFGEIDHNINYPKKTKDLVVSSLLKSMAKMAAAGSKLAETIGRQIQI